MPHDKHGTLLQPGDLVSMEFVIEDVYPHEEELNLLLRAAEHEPEVYLTCQARQVEKVRGDES